MKSLFKTKCRPCEDASGKLTTSEIKRFLKDVPGWQLKNGEIQKTFAFKNYYETVSFVNAAAWIAHTQDHHPEIEFGYKNCTIRYSTHSVKGLSENDFICAAKINALIPEVS